MSSIRHRALVVKPVSTVLFLASLLLTFQPAFAVVLGPTALTSIPEQQVFGAAWLKALHGGATLGEALLTAHEATLSQVPQSTTQGLIHTFNLLGDPALTLDVQ